MPRLSRAALVEELLDEGESARLVEMRVDLTRKKTGEVVWTSGGTWDRDERSYLERSSPGGWPDDTVQLGLNEAQVAAACWWVSWLSAHRRREHMRNEVGKPIFTMLLHGGRRGGKSNLAVKAAVHYAVAMPGAVIWIVVPKIGDKRELDEELDRLMPRSWYVARGEPEYVRELENGSAILIKSSWDSEGLKQGRCDVAILNEGQKHEESAFGFLRGAIVDKGGIVFITTNPPKKARGQWITELLEKIRAGRVGGVEFAIDPNLNPDVDLEALYALKDEMSDREFRSEVLGEFQAPENAVLFAFSETYNVSPPGMLPLQGGRFRALRNVTREATQRILGRPFDRVHGVDFQLTPHMPAITLELYEDPDDPGDILVWAVDDTTIHGTELDLVSALEAKGYSGDDAYVPDATGDFQNAERTKGKGSIDAFRMRGWRNVYFPIAGSKANPQRVERIAVGNGLFCTASGKRRLFIDPRLVELIKAVKRWEMRNGRASDRSDYTHRCDALTYPLYRLFPRRAPAAAGRALLISAPGKTGGLDGLR